MFEFLNGPEGILAAIEGSAFARTIGQTSGLYPALSAAHILGISLLVGPVVVVDLSLLRIIRSPAIQAAFRTLIEVAVVGFSIAAFTGALLFSVQAQKYAANPAFLIKLALLGAAGLNVALLHRTIGREFVAPRPSKAAQIAGAVSLLLWLAIIFSGRWIAFV